MDWDEILSKLTGIPKALLPTTLDDEPYAINAYLDEVSNNCEESSTALSQESSELPAQVAES